MKRRAWYNMGDIAEITHFREDLRSAGKFQLADKLRRRAWIKNGEWIIDGVDPWEYFGKTITQTWTHPYCEPKIELLAWMKLMTRVPHPNETQEQLERKQRRVKCRYCGHSYLKYCLNGIRR